MNSQEWDGAAGVNSQHGRRLYGYYGRPVYWGSEGHPSKAQPSTSNGGKDPTSAKPHTTSLRVIDGTKTQFGRKPRRRARAGTRARLTSTACLRVVTRVRSARTLRRLVCSRSMAAPRASVSPCMRRALVDRGDNSTAGSIALGQPDATLTVRAGVSSEQPPRNISGTDHRCRSGVSARWLETQPIFACVRAAVPPVVHGLKHSEPQRITPKLLEELHRNTAFAPEHLPRELRLIEAPTRGGAKFHKWRVSTRLSSRHAARSPGCCQFRNDTLGRVLSARIPWSRRLRGELGLRSRTTGSRDSRASGQWRESAAVLARVRVSIRAWVSRPPLGW